MNLRLKRTVAVAAVALTASLGLAACGGDDKEGSSSGKTESVGKKADTELTQENFFTELSKAQLEAGTSHVTMTMGVEGQEIASEGDISVDEDVKKSAMSMTMNLGAQKMDMRLIKSIMYINMGEVTQNKFAKIDLTDQDNPMTQQFGGMLEQADPAKQLEMMQDAITGFEQTGDAEKIDGVEATPYVVTVDTAKLTEQLGAAAEGAEGVPESMEYTIFVGPDNLPRRFVMDVMGSKSTMDYSKWGEPVTIEAPAKDEISEQGLAGLGG